MLKGAHRLFVVQIHVAGADSTVQFLVAVNLW